VVGAFACGALSVFLTALMVAVSLLFTEESFFEVAALVVTAHVPVMIIEGFVTAFCVGFLKKVKPDALPGFSYVPSTDTIE
jgi:cobalt/nickel transport system permease protein